MKIFGLPIPFTGEGRKAVMSSVSEGRGGGWYPIVREPFAGAWQRNISISTDTASSFSADFACKTLIARDIAKMRIKLVKRESSGIWVETESAAFSPVLRRPNDYQTRNQFLESWMLSKLSRGNTYVLKVRDNRNVVTALHVLDPTRVQPLVSDDGAVFYRLSSDNLAGIDEIIVPARELIHDRFNCLFHPLVGTPPVFASGLASLLGLNAQKASAILFQNASQPGGLLVAPAGLTEAEQQRIKEQWEQRFSRENLGRLAVITNDVRYEKLSMTAVEGQLIEQLKWSAEVVCSVYHVPLYKLGVGALPSYNNVQALNLEHYSQALQSHIEEIEESLDHGLGIGWAEGLGTELDTETLLRMDSITQVDMLTKAVQGAIMAPDEARAYWDLPPVPGGKWPLAQQQNYSLEALAKRDAQADPFAPATPPPAPQQDEPPPVDDDEEGLDEEKLAQIASRFTMQLKHEAACHG